MPNYDDYKTQLDLIRRTAPDDSEYWLARELQAVLEYERWENFAEAISRAKEACASADVPVENHFRETTKMIQIGKGGQRATGDWFLSKYACSLIAMNADPAKEAVGYAQTYFAIQTHKQEQQEQLTDVERRQLLRDRLKDSNKKLQEAAANAGVTKFGVFHDAGYKGLYGGLGLPAIKERKGLSQKDDLLDRAGRQELAMNEFKATQAEAKIIRENIVGERDAINAHHDVAQQVRATVRAIGGTMPEDLPAEPSLKQLAKQRAPLLLDGGVE